MNRFRIIFVLLFLGLMPLFDQAGLISTRAYALSLEDEAKMGRQFVDQITRHFELLDDSFAESYFNELGQYILRDVEPRYFPFHFYIIKHHMLNAFAAPGGYIFFFSGLIESLENVDELAAVLSHEIGHVTARHLAHRLDQAGKLNMATMAGVIAGVLLGGPAGMALMAGSQAATAQAMLNNSREDERQADQLGFAYSSGAGFDPAGMLGTLEAIQKGSLFGTDKIPSYLLTHPTGPERMANIETLLSQYRNVHPTFESQMFTEVFPFFKTVVIAKCRDPHDAELYFMGKLGEIQLRDEPSAALPHFGLGIVNMEMSKYGEAIRHLEKAHEDDPDFFPILTKLGEAYQASGQDEKAIKVLEKALILSNGNRSVLFLLGVSYENMEQYEKAIHIFEKIAAYKPVKKEVYYRLGTSYGRMNKLALAHYNLGVFFKMDRKAEKAAFHFKKAEELSVNDPALKGKIQKAMEDMPKS